MRQITEAIREHKREVLKYYDEDQLLGIFVYGSQNYGIDTEDSDVDTKAILIPSLRELCLEKPVSRELRLENGEHCEVKDIREMVKMFEKQNINFLEILYTDYYWVNPKYERLWKEWFISAKEDIATMDLRAMIKSITGQAIHTLKQNPKDGKKFANAERLYYTLDSLIKGERYGTAINMKSHLYSVDWAEVLKIYKIGCIKVSDAAFNELFSKLKELQVLADNYFPNDAVKRYMQNGVIALITNGKTHFDFY